MPNVPSAVKKVLLKIELFNKAATWGSGGFVKPRDYTIIGSAVGDSPSVDFEGVSVGTPDN